MRILYMGTPELAATVLSYLLTGPYPIVGVVCQPDKKQGRGMRTSMPPVKETALGAGIPVYQPESLKDLALLPVLEELKPDIIVVVAYGKILPSYILDFPPKGCVNLHASLLPFYRGAAPIQRAIMAGETVTGLSTMFLSEGMDEGDVIDKVEMPIGEDETAGELFDCMAKSGGPFLLETLHAIANGTAKATPQDHAKATYAPMLRSEDGHLPLARSAKEIYNHFRGVTPKPGAFSILNGKKVKIMEMKPLAEGIPENAKIGEVFLPGKGRLAVATGEGTAIEILILAPEGKKYMNATAFLNGRGAKPGDQFA
ncbi:MAG TPA: methionyl-tRNA formyltransferase [Clostridiales bacterium]|nr:methionyl-tRNA formyltransferase [Clostridiales bacterium]